MRYYTGFLVVKQRGRGLHATTKRPTLKPGEACFKLRVAVPDEAFDPAASVMVLVKPEHITRPEINAEVVA